MNTKEIEKLRAKVQSEFEQDMNSLERVKQYIVKLYQERISFIESLDGEATPEVPINNPIDTPNTNETRVPNKEKPDFDLPTPSSAADLILSTIRRYGRTAVITYPNILKLCRSQDKSISSNTVKDLLPSLVSSRQLRKIVVKHQGNRRTYYQMASSEVPIKEAVRRELKKMEKTEPEMTGDVRDKLLADTQAVPYKPPTDTP
jgi:hypothetical protein